MQLQLKSLNGNNMKLMRFVIFLLGIFIIIFLLSLLLPSNVTITKSVDINAPREKIINQIIDFEQWKNWHPSFKNENFSITKNEHPPNTISSVTLHDSIGKSLTIVLVDTSKQTMPTGRQAINMDLQSSSPIGINYQFVLIPKLSHQTQLTWNVIIHLGWLPWKKFEGILLDKFSGSQYENALNELKKAAESN